MTAPISSGPFFKTLPDGRFEVSIRHPYSSKWQHYVDIRVENRKFIKWVKKQLKDKPQKFDSFRMQGCDIWGPYWNTDRYYYPPRYDRFYVVTDLSKDDLMLIKLAWKLQEWVD